MFRSNGVRVYLSAVETHQGAVRGNNEDDGQLLIADLENPWAWGVVVADGMGGGQAGEIASRTVARTIESRIQSWRVSDPTLLGARWAAQFRTHLAGIVHEANTALLAKAEKDESLTG